jgi:hypothetical protein
VVNFQPRLEIRYRFALSALVAVKFQYVLAHPAHIAPEQFLVGRIVVSYKAWHRHVASTV